MLKSLYELLKTLIIAAFIAFFLIRGFIFEPYRIPSGSMEPTLLKGDFLFVSKFAYGNRLPMTNFFFWQKPVTRGDIVVFKKTADYLPGSFFGFGPVLFIKRVVAIPGDTIEYKNKRLYINGEKMAWHDAKPYTYFQHSTTSQNPIEAEQAIEILTQREHKIAHNPANLGINVASVTVPQGQYVVMGDNRDNSRDSRFWSYPNWGFVPKHDIMGRADFIFWSWSDGLKPRLERIFNTLHAQKTTPTS